MKYEIYQIKDEYRRQYGFANLDILPMRYREDTDHPVLISNGVVPVLNIDAYNKVYEGDTASIGGIDRFVINDPANPMHKQQMRLLEHMFEVFNLYHPSDYRAPSMSVGDLVVLYPYDDSNREAFFCDSFSWKPIELMSRSGSWS
jgi:hypothetical protein